MNLKQVRIKNFRGYGENQSDSEGFYIFDGLENPFVIFNGFNGFGKTSLFEAIEWCFTDEVQRLTAVESIYDKRDMKTSHYLKFFHPEGKSTKDRQIAVELLFDNGLRITRTSYSASHKVGNGDHYSSELLKWHDDGTTSVISEVEVMAAFQRSEGPLQASQFLKTHMLAQESMNHFIRTETPKDRRNIFMRLLNYQNVFTFNEDVNGLSPHSFTTKKEEISSKNSELQSVIDGINHFLQMKQFNSMDDYLSKFRQANQDLVSFIEANTTMDDVPVSELLKGEEITLNMCVSFQERYQAMYESYNSIKVDVSQKGEKLAAIKEIIGDLDKLGEGIRLIKSLSQAVYVRATDYRALADERTRLGSERETIETQMTVMVNRKAELVSFKTLPVVLSEGLRKEQFLITDQFWADLSSVQTYWSLLLTTFKLEIDQVAMTQYEPEPIFDRMRAFKPIYIELAKQMRQINQQILVIDAQLRTRTMANTALRNVLEQVKTYLISEDSEGIACPVCLNTDFSGSQYDDINEKFTDDTPVKERLLHIMDASISSGDEAVGLLSNDLTRLKVELAEVQRSIGETVIAVLLIDITTLATEYRSQYTRINNALEELEKAAQTVLSRINERIPEIEKQQQNYVSCCIAMFGDDYDITQLQESDISQLILDLENKKSGFIKEITERFHYEYEPNLSRLDETLTELKQRQGVSDYFPSNLINLDRDIEQTAKKLAYVDQLLQHLNTLFTYKVSEEFDKKLHTYVKSQEDIIRNKERIIKLTTYAETVKTLKANTARVQKEILETKLSRHPIISWIYENISPHPFHKKLLITSDAKGANFKNEREELHLDHIFSAAQLNVLALSVFLGLGLSQRYSLLDQVFLDDPIQSMDDVNILALIDVFRAIQDTKNNRKKIIISTHDNNFAKLLAIKMRNRSYTQYNFVGYGAEGPKVERTIHIV
jgi:exonuclease SbcC